MWECSHACGSRIAVFGSLGSSLVYAVQHTPGQLAYKLPGDSSVSTSYLSCWKNTRIANACHCILIFTLAPRLALQVLSHLMSPVVTAKGSNILTVLYNQVLKNGSSEVLQWEEWSPQVSYTLGRKILDLQSTSDLASSIELNVCPNS